jgi:hypothetical protein
MKTNIKDTMGLASGAVACPIKWQKRGNTAAFSEGRRAQEEIFLFEYSLTSSKVKLVDDETIIQILK